MVAFERRSWPESIKRLWPPYRNSQDKQNQEALQWLLENPEAPCVIDGEFIENGYGKVWGLLDTLMVSKTDQEHLEDQW